VAHCIGLEMQQICFSFEKLGTFPILEDVLHLFGTGSSSYSVLFALILSTLPLLVRCMYVYKCTNAFAQVSSVIIFKTFLQVE
jgi:hypothetical protein